MKMQRSTCKNCYHVFKGRFCNFCGQKSDTRKIDYQFFITEIPNSIFNLNKGILFTMKEMTIHPIKVVTDYVKGKRILYFSPFLYIIVLATTFLLLKKANIFINYQASEVNSQTEKLKIMEYLGLILILSAPIFGLASRWFFKKKTVFNFWEYIVINTFFLGQFMFFVLIMLICLLPFPEVSKATSEFRFVILMFYLIVLTFRLHFDYYKNKALLFLRSLFWFATAFFMSVTIIGPLYVLYRALIKNIIH